MNPAEVHLSPLQTKLAYGFWGRLGMNAQLEGPLRVHLCNQPSLLAKVDYPSNDLDWSHSLVFEETVIDEIERRS